MSDHRHEFAVDASCECGVMISTLIHSQHAEIARLRTDFLIAQRAATQPYCGHEAELLELRAERDALRAELSNKETQSVEGLLAPFLAVARAAETALTHLEQLGHSPTHSTPYVIRELCGALAHPAVVEGLRKEEA